MRPDLEDYADIDEPVAAGRSRAMSWMVLSVAVGGFAALAYYAYNSGTRPVEGDMLVIEADGSPIKEVPADVEGEQFANKDKTIYDVISPSDGDGAVEKLLPEPEKPVAAANTEDTQSSATTFVATPEANKADPMDVPVRDVPVEKPLTTALAPAAPVSAKPIEKPVTTTAATPVVEQEKSFSSPEMINEKPVVVTAKPEAKTVEKVAEKPKAVEKPVAAKSGTYMVQLGAFKSEAEAQSSWKKISGKYSDVLNGSPTIVKAEVNGGTFYRLRTGSFATADAAKATCAKLAGQACMPVK